jgi:hypothetical protein
MTTTFEDFKAERYNEPPYDLLHNPQGFGRGNGSDISAHLPFLEFLARNCNVITELGTRDCYSTAAFISGKPQLDVSYDIEERQAMKQLASLDLPCKWELRLVSSVDPATVIPISDLLFIDTLHTYGQVKEELRLHATRVTRWIVFHDTVSFPEINQAINEFLESNKVWQKVYDAKFNHGLIVLETAR